MRKPYESTLQISLHTGMTEDQVRVLSRTRSGMIARCHNPNNPAYKHYGERGIDVCSQWRESLLEFCRDMGARPDGMSVDRIDNNRGYYPDNCRWASVNTQSRNKRTTKVSERIIKNVMFDYEVLDLRYNEIAKHYNISSKHVGDIINGRRFIIPGINDNRPDYRQWNRKLNHQNIEEMKKLRKEGWTYKCIGKKFGVDRTTARDAINGVTYKDSA